VSTQREQLAVQGVVIRARRGMQRKPERRARAAQSAAHHTVVDRQQPRTLTRQELPSDHPVNSVLGAEEVPGLVRRRALDQDVLFGVGHVDVPGNGVQQTGQPRAEAALQNVQRDRRRNGDRQGLHRDQILRRDSVGALRPVSPTGQMLEPAAGERHRAGRQTDPEVAAQIVHHTLCIQQHAQPLPQRQ
jgi:hypothetical protein